MKKIKIALLSLVLFAGTSLFLSVASATTDSNGLVIPGAGGAQRVINQVPQMADRYVESAFNDWIYKLTGQKATPDGSLSLPAASEFGAIGENTSFRLYLQKVVNFVLSFLGLIAVIFLIYAGYLYVVDGGGDGLKDKAKKIIIYVSIGILVILASYALVNTLIQEAPGGGSDRGGSNPNNPGAPGQIDFSFETQDSDSLFF